MKISNQISLYAQSGASVISVLTEERHFKGSLNDLRFARDAIIDVSSENNNKRPALLRKDFIMNTRMIDEAIAAGADTVLLIVAILPKPLLKKLIDHCRTYLTMDKVPIEPLVEVHTLPIELDVALECGAKVIGVNNRNLHTFKLDMRTTECAAKIMMEKGLNFDHRDNDNNNNNNEYALCALSGMSGPDDVERYRSVGVGMVLVGEGLMRSNDPAATIRSFGLDPSINNTNSFSSNQNKASKEVDTTITKDATIAPNTIVIPQSYTSGTKLIKVCGITRPADALEACSAGANLIGIIFASRSKRKIESNDHAIQIVNVVRNFGERDARISFDNKLVVDDSIIQTTTFCKLSNKAQTLQNVVSRTPLVVGVFQDQDIEYVKNTALATGLDLIQLHGNEGMEASSSTNYGGIPVIRVIDVEVGGVTTKNDEPNVIAKGIAKAITSHPIAILLDSTVRSTTTTIKGGGGTGGGTGKTFDWRIAHELQKLGLPVIMAGGLSSVNVRDAVSGCSGLGEVEGGGGGGKCGGPWGIDASSGLEVEGRPGVKDVERLRGYVSGARLAAAEN